jgi:3-dehydroquinate synthase
LSPRDIRSGLAEGIKYGIIKDSEFFSYLEKNYKDALLLKSAGIEHIVNKCSSIKAGYVSLDERENKGIRIALNYGHTLAHAIEAATGYSAYNHGESVALGMLIAADISKEMGLTGDATVKRIETLIKRVGLPLKIRKLRSSKIIAAYYRDKKFKGARNRLVLISAIGKTITREGVPLGLIKRALAARS